MKGQNPGRVCTRCVMDTSDPNISFDKEGICNHCYQYDVDISQNVVSGEEGNEIVAEQVALIRHDGRGKKYDCIIGVSGGVDSTYVAYKVKELGLRPLAVHFDNGWNSELAVGNIERILTKLDIDLDTYVVDWKEFRDIQLAFLKSSTPDSEIPTDHAIVSLMNQAAKKMGIRHVIPGTNVRTETHLPAAWSRGHGDWEYIRSVHKLFGTKKIKTYPHSHLINSIRYKKTLDWFPILDYIDFVKGDAKKLLENEFDWRDYGGKHYESVYTRFYQGYILPKKFGFDKRRSHLSSLICSDEIERKSALEELTKPPYPIPDQQNDREYVAKKLGLTVEEFDQIMQLPLKTFGDYPSYSRYYSHPIIQSLKNVVKKILGKRSSVEEN
jgi:N-acetyl sugar amidotransferase